VKDRAGLSAALDQAGIQTLVHYPIAPHRQQAYAELGFGPGSFPIAERLAEEVLSLPLGPHLPREQAERVADSVRSWAKARP
jgi:dTDP-4-amino-4,6-dideoxygalactose transaminase